MLALEIVECPEVHSIEKCMRFVQACHTLCCQVHPKVGNLTASEVEN
jgi:L-ribulose-5-phosphate 3-epimerase UlaE